MATYFEMESDTKTLDILNKTVTISFVYVQ